MPLSFGEDTEASYAAGTPFLHEEVRNAAELQVRRDDGAAGGPPVRVEGGPEVSLGISGTFAPRRGDDGFGGQF